LKNKIINQLKVIIESIVEKNGIIFKSLNKYLFEFFQSRGINFEEEKLIKNNDNNKYKLIQTKKIKIEDNKNKINKKNIIKEKEEKKDKDINLEEENISPKKKNKFKEKEKTYKKNNDEKKEQKIFKKNDNLEEEKISQKKKKRDK